MEREGRLTRGSGDSSEEPGEVKCNHDDNDD